MKPITNLSDTFALNNGYAIPCMGFGTWRIPAGETTYHAVRSAIASGFHHIDAAAIYKNEVSVGQAIADSGVARHELFITSKVWATERKYDQALAAFDKTASDLGVDYLDLYLIHWPQKRQEGTDWQKVNEETWRALEKLYTDGRVKAIGVSNFLVHHLEPLLQSARVQPAVNQIEFHPGQMQIETVRYCQNKGMVVEAWSPLGSGFVLSQPLITSLADKYDRTPAQICLRWCLQNGVLPLTRTVTPARVIENMNVFDFELSPADMQLINDMEYCGGSGLHPDTMNF